MMTEHEHDDAHALASRLRAHPALLHEVSELLHLTPLTPAEAACHLQCTGASPPPPTPTPALACTTDADCTDPSLPTCVVQADKAWAQCISCTDKPFQNSCTDWEKAKFLPAAEAKCGKTCTGPSPLSPPPPPPPLACHTDADCKDATHPKCVVQADGAYAQCITCDAAQFELDCTAWEKAKFLPAAEAKCGLTCQQPPALVEAAAPFTDCHTFASKAACGGAQCSWCTAGAVPDSCKTVAEAKQLPASVFDCDNI